MKRQLWAALMSAAVLMSTVVAGVGAAPASASPTGRTLCLPVYATGNGQDLGNFHTSAQIFVGPVLVATTAASFTPTGVDGDSLSFVGPIVFTAIGNLGAFTVSATGTVDASTGDFEANGPITAPTGLLAGTTGQLTLMGTESLTSGAFTETVTGQLCAGGAGSNIMAP
jgi:hypothetical protein